MRLEPSARAVFICSTLAGRQPVKTSGRVFMSRWASRRKIVLGRTQMDVYF